MAENEKTNESNTPPAETPAAGTPEAAASQPAPAHAAKAKEKEKPAPSRTAPRFSAFSGLAKFLTDEQRAKLAAAPEEPTVTVESADSRRDDRRGRRPERGERRDRPARREGGDFRGGERRDRPPRPAGERRDRPPRREGEARGNERRDREGRGRGQQRGAPPRALDRGPKLDNVVSAAEKTGLQEAGFAQGLFAALEAEVERFAGALSQIDGLDAGLREVTVEQARRLLDFAKKPLERTIDGASPLVIGVVGGAGVGKSMLIEALAGDAGHPADRADDGRLSTVWHGIRFVETPGDEHVDGLVEIRMEGVAPVHAGRPLLVIENMRVNLHDGFAFDRFLKDPESILGPTPRVDEIDEVPKVALPAFSLATQPQHKARSAQLRQLSRFDLVEGALARRLSSRARLLRIQRFIDDFIEAVLPLRDYALTVNLQSHLEAKAWQGRLAETTAELAKWGEEARASVQAGAAAPLASLRGQLEAFVNKHAGDRNVQELWEKRIAGLNFKAHEAAELKRLAESFRAVASAVIERTKAARQPGEGPLPQPVLMAEVPPIFRETTNAFRNKLAGVIDPLQWVLPVEAGEIDLQDALAPLPQDVNRLAGELTKRLDRLEKRLADDVLGKLNAGIVAPVDRRLSAESRAILDALFNLGREGHAMIAVVNEVLLSLVQRLVERAAENHGIKLPLVQKMVREPGHRTKLLVPASRDLFMLARRLQDALGERVDLVPAVEQTDARIAAALLPAKIKPGLIKVNEEKRMAQVKVPRGESGKAFGRNGGNQRLAAALTGYHLHLRIAKDKDLQELAQANAAAQAEKAAARAAAKAARAAEKAAAEKPAEPAAAAEPTEPTTSPSQES